MKNGSRFGRVYFSILICVFLGIAACTTADYTDGINSISQAISQANTTEQILAAPEEKVEVTNYIKHSAGKKAVVDLSRCRGTHEPYKVGDCIVKPSEERVLNCAVFAIFSIS